MESVGRGNRQIGREMAFHLQKAQKTNWQARGRTNGDEITGNHNFKFYNTISITIITIQSLLFALLISLISF